MRCPTLNELPRPSLDKTGWPWTEECEQLPATMPNSEPWPRLSIVTPSYNQAQFLEETIRSVLLQGYPNLEYIIIDGGSDDGSVEIIRRYEPWLIYWVSENDDGQAHAINKGFRRTTGEIVAWLNSDDTYQSGAVKTAIKALQKYPSAGMVYGDARVIDHQGSVIKEWHAPPFCLEEQLLTYQLIPQQTAFFRFEVLDAVGLLDESLHYAMDYDLWLRIGKAFEIRKVDALLATYREHTCSKTVSDRHANRPEILKVLRRFFAQPGLPASLEALEGTAYGILHFHIALHHFQLNRVTQGITELEKAFSAAPTLVTEHEERILQMLLAYAPDGLQPGRAYFDIIFANLPDQGQGFKRLRNKAETRFTLIQAGRSDQTGDLAEARKQMPLLIRDLRWLHDKTARELVVRLILSRKLVEAVVAIKRRLKQATQI